MRKAVFILGSALVLGACGGGNRDTVDRAATYQPIRAASGVIASACSGSERGAGKGTLCNCIQGVANTSLSGSDQRLAAKFFRDPHHAQEIRQSDNPQHEVFWKRYKAFAADSERYCRA